MNAAARNWKARFNGTEYGPYTTHEMLAYLDERRITATTEVQHPQITQGLWLTARLVKILRDQLEQRTDREVQPPTPPPITKHHQALPAQAQVAPLRRRSRVFKWILLAIWGAWLWMVIFTLFANLNHYDHTAGNLVVTTQGILTRSEFRTVATVGAMIFSVFAALPATIASAIAYFFTRDA